MSFLSHKRNSHKKEAGRLNFRLRLYPVELIADKLPSGRACFLLSSTAPI